jgi:UDP:flavonoid glycosyltransferase YjiC (YdhE family)
MVVDREVWMRFLIASVGSNGDIHPYMGVGMALAERGHQIGFLAQPYFERMIREAGFSYFQMGEPFEMSDLAKHPEMMSPWFGTVHILRGLIFPQIGAAVAAAESAIRSFQPDALFAHHLCFGLPWAAERHGLPVVLGALSPLVMLSRQDPCVYNPAGQETRPGWRAWLHLKIARFGCRLLYDPPLNRWRRELGFPKGRDWFLTDLRNATRVLALWSSYFRSPMSDDPANALICGFPWYDRHKQQEHASDEIDRFLDEGDPPIIFTLGSTAVHVAGPFYQAAAGACRLLGRRGMLLTGRPEYAPRSLPPGVRAFTYAPYGEVLSRGCATVHHGGIGTTAQGLRSGNPTVVMPFAHDQFDNAARVRRLGVSATASRKRVSGETLATALRQVLENPHCVRSAAELGSKVRSEDGAVAAAKELEAVCEGRGFHKSKSDIDKSKVICTI